MEALEYIQGINNICKEHEEKEGCNPKCPLIEHLCGIPRTNEEADKVIKLVEHWKKERKYPKKTYAYLTYKKCLRCNNTYPPETPQRYCDCKSKGFLYPISVLYQPKVKNTFWTRNSLE